MSVAPYGVPECYYCCATADNRLRAQWLGWHVETVKGELVWVCWECSAHEHTP